MDRAGLRRLVASKADCLTMKQMRVVRLVLEGHSMHQVARILGKDRAGVREMFHRALRRLSLPDAS